MRLPEETKSYQYGTDIAPEGAEWGYILKYRLKESDGMKTNFFSNREVEQLDNNPKRFYQRYAGILKVVGKQRLKCWRYQKIQIRIAI
jgi:hypothetical protein